MSDLPLPSHARHSATSRAAAHSMKKPAASLRVQVYQYIRRARTRGATCAEIEAAMGLRHQTASARVRELALADNILNSGRKRKTESGRNAVVWVAVPHE